MHSTYLHKAANSSNMNPKCSISFGIHLIIIKCNHNKYFSFSVIIEGDIRQRERYVEYLCNIYSILYSRNIYSRFQFDFVNRMRRHWKRFAWPVLLGKLITCPAPSLAHSPSLSLSAFSFSSVPFSSFHSNSQFTWRGSASKTHIKFNRIWIEIAFFFISATPCWGAARRVVGGGCRGSTCST